MQNKEQSALLVHRENYIVPKGEEHAVHYKIAKMTSDGSFIEPARIVKSRVKQFDTIEKRGLELGGYTIEILFHPLGTYTNVRIEDKNVVLKRQEDEIAALKAQLAGRTESDKDAEIASLKAQIEELKKAKDNKAGAGKGERKPKSEEGEKGE